MTQEEKDLVLRDLCARLPYSPFVKLMEKFDDEDSEHFREIHNLSTYDIELLNSDEISSIIPYLRPLSSMTEEETVEYCDLQDKFIWSSQYPVTDGYALFDWLNAHHFDYRGLIEKGLAIAVTEDNNLYNNIKD